MDSGTPANAVTVADQPMLPEAFMSTTSLIMDQQLFANMLALADVMSSAVATIPKHFHKNRGDCLAVIMQSAQWGMTPFAVAQKTHLVNGVLGYEAQLVNAVIIARAPIKNRLRFEWFGPWDKIVGKFVERESKKKDDNGEAQKYRAPAWKIEDEGGCGVKVFATLRGEEEPRELTLLMTQARTRNSTLWADDPKQQLAYLAIKRWSRLYCPDVIMGVYTKDELEEPRDEIDVTPARAAADPSADLLLKTLVGLLEREAKFGYAGLKEVYGALDDAQRRLIPSADWTRIKASAVAADKATADAAKATAKEPVATQEQTPPATNQPKNADPATPANAPTYAQLVAHVHIATTGDELLQIQSDASHLTEQMQSEIRAACTARAKTLSANA